jgi:ubiquinone/menaquinone biosynthesis C-methylase UbiE
MGIVNEVVPQQFEATDLTTCLQTDSPESLKDFVLLRAEQDYLCWKELPYTVKTGKSAFEQTFGMSRYRYNQQTAERSELFDRTMSALASKQKFSILFSYDFSEIDTLVDVGGGQGNLLVSILKQYPNVKAVLFDQAETIERAQKLLEKEQLNSRCEVIAGSFFEVLPEGKDVYMLKHVLHNWDDEQALKILQNCRRAMVVGKKLLIIEGLISQKAALRSVLLDLMMLVSFASGKLRTESEFEKLLHTSGFTLNRIISTPSDVYIIEASAI